MLDTLHPLPWVSGIFRLTCELGSEVLQGAVTGLTNSSLIPHLLTSGSSVVAGPLLYLPSKGRGVSPPQALSLQ